MTDPREPLADPARERLVTHPTEARLRRYRYRARHLDERPPAEFSPHIRTLVYLAAVLGVILAVAVLSYVAMNVWRIP